ncbi:MAG: SDR family NAD(P)-dependent oxidoreductase [Candidatus Latescibacterota bacterium]
MQLAGKVALVTGGTKGIGAATALMLATRGADVAILGRHDTESARKVRADIEAMGRRSHLIIADMAKREDAARAVEETDDVLGGVDVLIHNAGGGLVGNFLETAEEDWYRLFDIHVHAAFHLCRAALPYMWENRQGVIIMVSSVAAHRGVPNIVPYGVVKGALLQFARGLAREYADYNIRVNCVSPGIIRTDFHAAMTPEQEKHNLDNRIPLHRFGTPEQVAEVITLLVQNDFITGENYTVDGGMTMRMV